nr:divergent polysaccharide deacetylase family protein [Rhizobiaceae bacterium]
LDRWMQAARRDGHEILLQVPMQPQDGAAPGRHTLETGLGPDENRARLHRALARTTNYVGIMNFMGARFTADEAAFAPVMAELSARGLMYLDDGTSARSLAPASSQTAGVPFAQADMMIDVQRQPGAILQRLNDLEQIARSQGLAVGVGSAFEETVQTVANWMNEAKMRGIEFVPVSAAALDPEGQR